MFFFYYNYLFLFHSKTFFQLILSSIRQLDLVNRYTTLADSAHQRPQKRLHFLGRWNLEAIVLFIGRVVILSEQTRVSIVPSAHTPSSAVVQVQGNVLLPVRNCLVLAPHITVLVWHVVPVNVRIVRTRPAKQHVQPMTRFRSFDDV